LSGDSLIDHVPMSPGMSETNARVYNPSSRLINESSISQKVHPRVQSSRRGGCY
jgi:hypothetical protein